MKAAGLLRTALVSAVALGALIFPASAPAPVIIQVPLAWTLNSSASPPTIATPYPSSTVVSGTVGSVTNATVTLNNIFHSNLANIQGAVVGPGGQALLLANASPGPANNVILTFDDTAASSLNCGASAVSGTYKTTACAGPAVNFPAPAPPGPYFSLQLNVFNGQSANGTWSVYLVDTSNSGPTGNIQNGWTLRLDGVDFASPTPSTGTANNCISMVDAKGNPLWKRVNGGSVVDIRGNPIGKLKLIRGVGLYIQNCGPDPVNGGKVDFKPKGAKKGSAVDSASCGFGPIAPGVIVPLPCKPPKKSPKGTLDLSATGCVPIAGTAICVFPYPLIPVTLGYEVSKKKK